jgi:hypothetical protein
VDNTEAFGSSGHLKSMIYLSFGALSVFDHEVTHIWGAAIGASLGLLQEGNATQGHWLDRSDIDGQLGGYYVGEGGLTGHFTDNGDVTWSPTP